MFIAVFAGSWQDLFTREWKGDPKNAINEMNILQKDEIGVPSTLVAILANVFQAIGVDFINVVFTMIISVTAEVISKKKNYKTH